MDIKKLKKLYEEYKKIGQPKGYDEGGKVPEHDKKNLKKLNDSFGKFIKEESGEKIKGYADGTSDGDPVEKLQQNVNSDFNFPNKAPHELSREERNAAIRKQNSSNATGETSPMDQHIYSPGDTSQQYADGGEVLPDVNQDLNQSPSVKKPDDSAIVPYQVAPKQNAPIATDLSKYYGMLGHFKGGNIKGYADGGDVSDEQPETVSDYSAKEQAQPAQNPDMVSSDLADQGIQVPSDVELPKEEADAEKVVDQQEALKDQLPDDSKKDQEEPEDKGSDKKPASEESEEVEEPTDQEKQDIEQSGYSGTAEGVSKPPTLQEQLAAAQKQRQDMTTAAALTQFGNLAGAGFAGRSGARVEPLPPSYFESLKAGAQLPVQNIEEQIKLQSSDPNSDFSKQYSQSVASLLGIDPAKTQGMSADVLGKSLPLALKKQAMDTTIKRVGIQQEGANKRADKRNAIEKQKADAATANAASNKDLKAQAAQDRALQQTKQMLESARGNPAAAQAEKDLYSVGKTDSLFKLYPDLDKIPDAQKNLIIQEVAKVATGGVPPGHEINALDPNTPEAKLQKLWGQAVNQPQGAGLGAYLKELKKYTTVLGSDAQKVIQDKYGRVIESSKKQLGDDNYKALQDQYINRFNPPETKVHPEDSKALDWAKNNPNDPRAAQILKVNGIQ